MKFDNDLTRMLGIKYPIIQGAFGPKGMGGSAIAVPVSEAGGLGILTSVSYENPDEFREDIRKARAATSNPFAVNFTIYKEGPHVAEFHKDFAQIAVDEGVKVAFTSAYVGSQFGKMFHDVGGHWIHKCATIKHAISAAQKGADAVVIVGLEGTGFKSPDQNTTLINITATRKLIDVPLIAAGGIGDAHGFVAALAMGAQGIYMGTAFMATKEFRCSDKLKKRIVDQAATDAEYSRKIYSLSHGAGHSLSSLVVDSIPTVKEFIDGIIEESEGIMAGFKRMGMIDD